VFNRGTVRLGSESVKGTSFIVRIAFSTNEDVHSSSTCKQIVAEQSKVVGPCTQS
jgi:hypothetical protein